MTGTETDVLRFLGLMRRAGKLSAGEEGTRQSVRAHKACRILLASDASCNAKKRAEEFACRVNIPVSVLPFDKDTISEAVGAPPAAMLAVCDRGFSAALMKKLAVSENTETEAGNSPAQSE